MNEVLSKQRGPRTYCSYRSSLIWVHTVCHRGFLNISADEKSRQFLLQLAYNESHLNHLLKFIIKSSGVTSGNDITPCIKIDKPLEVYILSYLCNDVHTNVAYVLTFSLQNMILLALVCDV